MENFNLPMFYDTLSKKFEIDFNLSKLYIKISIVFNNEEHKNYVEKLSILSPCQFKTIYALIVDEPEVFVISGIAGSGKSFVLKLFVIYLQNCVQYNSNAFHIAEKCIGNCNQTFRILAPTGVSAININGITLDTYLGGYSSVMRKTSLQTLLKSNPPSNEIEIDFKMLLPYIEDIPDREESFLLVDECFMIHGLLIMCILMLKKKKPCMRLLFMGDPYQFAPIAANKGWRRDFMEFVKTFGWTYTELSTIVRTSDAPLSLLIKALRQAIKLASPLNKFACLFLYSLSRVNTEEEFNKIKDYKMIITRTHLQSIACNRLYLQELPGPSTIYKADASPNVPTQIAKALSSTHTVYINDLRIYNKLELKVGASIMMTKNMPLFKNGTMAEVKELFPNKIRIKLANGTVTTIFPLKYHIEEQCFVKQYPIIVARGINIQKLQGITWKHPLLISYNNYMDKRSLYVCISRLTNIQNLYFKYLFNKQNYRSLYTEK